ncbi:hypothetical protein F383_12928 [Gossypium arboreum]|uniref:Uncharacterized protein n=1 Tax=Gossypium arboreum TaxID=29729 RepID=A0A0B0MC27_GOSAR|nr:hypothetical protein F383_12928 [Gossypium arboreum]
MHPIKHVSHKVYMYIK